MKRVGECRVEAEKKTKHTAWTGASTYTKTHNQPMTVIKFGLCSTGLVSRKCLIFNEVDDRSQFSS